MTPSPFRHPVHMSPRRLAHANLFVGDLEKSLDFFHRVCGLEIVLRQPAIGAGFVSNGNTHHDIGMIQATSAAVLGEGGHRILAPGQGRKPGLNHLGWEMESEFALTKAYERAIAAGWKIHRTVRHLSSHSVYLFDPDGNIHEFYADVSKNWRELYDKSTRVSGEWTPGERRPSMDARYHESPQIRRVESAPLHPLRITHAVLVARQFERMCEFFRNGMGLMELSRDDGRGLAAFGAPAASYPFCVALVRLESGASARERGLHHISFQLQDSAAFDAASSALARKGVAVERTVDEPHKRGMFLRDPDGGLIEFYCRNDQPLDVAAVSGRDEAAFLL